MKTKKFRPYLGNGNWGDAIELGAEAANVDYIKGSGATATTVSVQDELDDLNEQIIPEYKFNTIADMNAAIAQGLVEDGATIYVKQNSGGGGGNDVGLSVDEYGRICLTYDDGTV